MKSENNCGQKKDWASHVVAFSRCLSERERVVIFLLFVFSFLLRVFVAWHLPEDRYYWHTDSEFYWGNAQALVKGETLPYGTSIPAGFPLVLSLFIALGGTPYAFVWFVQSVLGAVTVVLFYRIARRFSGILPAFLCGVFLMLYPPLLNLTRQLVTETTFIFMLAAGLDLITGRHRWLWLVGGGLLGWAATIRWPGVLMAACIMACLWRLPPRPWRRTLVCAGMALLLLGVGVVLQSLQEGKLVVISGQSAQSTWYRSIPGGYESLEAQEIHARGAYLSHLLNHPGEFLMERVYAAANLFSPWPLGDSRSQGVRWMIALSDAPVFLLFLLALWLSRKTRWDRELWLLLMPLLGSLMIYLPLFAQMRYRWPFMPFLFVFSLCVLSRFLTAKREGTASRLHSPSSS